MATSLSIPAARSATGSPIWRLSSLRHPMTSGALCARKSFIFVSAKADMPLCGNFNLSEPHACSTIKSWTNRESSSHRMRNSN